MFWKMIAVTALILLPSTVMAAPAFTASAQQQLAAPPRTAVRAPVKNLPPWHRRTIVNQRRTERRIDRAADRQADRTREIQRQIDEKR